MSKAQGSSPFLWGVATSSYQIEGAVNEDGRGPSIWDTFSHTPGKVAGGDTGDVACDHYHRWADDLDLVRDLGVGAYRFSVAWPRILPEGTGKVNSKGLDFYDRLVDGMLERNLKPFCTLYHWDLPQALEDRGGWPERSIVDAFVHYADVVTERLGDRVYAYATLNEPWCSAHLGYCAGEHAPGKRDLGASLAAAHHLLLAHGLALPVMRRNAPAARHGIVLNFTPTYPAGDTPEDQQAAWRLDGLLHRWYADPLLKGSYPEEIWRGYGANVPVVEDGDLTAISTPLDYLGVNYYTRMLVAHQDGAWPQLRVVPNPTAERTAMDWEVYPQGLTDLLVRLQREYGHAYGQTDPLPLYVTENGAAYPDRLEGDRVHDAERLRYFERHIAAVQQARDAGVAVRGYFAWSLLDNFEWAHGYDKRFGIVYVDFASQRRVVKDSGRLLRRIASGQHRT